MLKSLIWTITLVLLSITQAYAREAPIQTHVPNAAKVGTSRLTYLFWDIYDATLYAPNGHWKHNAPFALKLSYLRALEGEEIADRSIEEMRSQGFNDEVRLADWHAQMRSIFPNVQQGNAITGIYTRTGETLFYEDGQIIGQIKDPAFGRHFFNIWLSPNTSEPNMRIQLLGQS